MRCNASVLMGVALAAIVLAPHSARSQPVTHTDTTINGLRVDRYVWSDSRGRPRSVALKKEGNGNPGHGGYAVQMTYQINTGGGWQTIIVNAVPGIDGGFGYFVSHERYRDFSDGSNDTIAGKVFNADDSPYGTRFPVVGTRLFPQNPNAAAHRFTMTYPRYGTRDAIPKDSNGNDVRPTPVARTLLRLYSLPITIIWVFQSGTDYPRIQTTVSLANVPGPDRVNFDIRGPYGVMNFDNGANNAIARVIWGDRYHFASAGQPLTRNRAWNWFSPNRGARYHALIAGAYEMGLVEPRTFAASTLPDGYADARHKTSATFNGGQGCPDQDQLLPCDWEWPYQSAQYSLPYNNPNAPTNFEKITWGSAPLWGSGASLPRVYDTANTWKVFNGFPASRRITYNICVVLGRTIADGLTRSVAAGPAYRCATAAAP